MVLERSEQLPERTRKEAIPRPQTGLATRGQIWTLIHRTDVVILCEEDSVVQSESSGIRRVKDSTAQLFISAASRLAG